MSWLGRLLGKGGKEDGAMAWRAFVEEYAARIEQGLGATVTPEWGASPDLATLRIQLANGAELHAVPGNLWRACSQAPQQREALIANMLETLREAALEQPQSSGLTPARVLPVIRNGAWAEEQRQLMARAAAQTGAEEEALLYLPGPGELIIAFVEDKPDRMRTLYSSALAQLGLSDVAALYNSAVKNLFGRAASVSDVAPGVFRLHLDGDYDSSLFLMARDTLPQLGLSGAPAIGVPSYGECLLCSADDEAALDALRSEVALRHARAHKPLSTEVYIDRDGWLVLPASVGG